MTALRSQSVACEILVVDSSSTDDTCAIAEECGARVLPIPRSAFDHGGTRNFGVRNASGEIIVFLTQDALPVDTHLIENLLSPLQSADIPFAYGRQVARPEASPPERFQRAFNYPETPRLKGKEHIPELGIKTFYVSNVCSAVRRREFEEAGGFPERIILNEDMMFAATLIMKGYRVAYAANAAVYHSHAYTLRQQFRRYFDIGVSLNRNRWVLEAVRPEREGRKALSLQVRYLVQRREWRWVPYVAAEAVFKYMGYRLGLSEDLVPLQVKRLLSMHRHFWNHGAL